MIELHIELVVDDEIIPHIPGSLQEHERNQKFCDFS